MNLKEFLLGEIAKDESASKAVLADDGQWFNAPIPRRWHACWTQSEGWVNDLTHVRRCACGAIQMNNDGYWLDRNSRRG